MPGYSDDDDVEEEDVPCCDWCSKESKRRSLIMGYTEGCDEGFKWGKGDLVCARCLKEKKMDLYCCKYKGKQIFCTQAYWDKYWHKDNDAVIVRTPQDHQSSIDAAQKKKEKEEEKAKKKKKRNANANAKPESGVHNHNKRARSSSR